MAVNINATTTSGVQISSDNSGTVALQNNGTNGLSLDASGNATIRGNVTISGTGNQSIAGTLQFNSGYGSVATAYGCRAWVNFNGQGTVAIRASGNVSSITDNGTGDYTVNFTTTMPDSNYAGIVNTSDTPVFNRNGGAYTGTRTSSAFRILTAVVSTITATDIAEVSVAIFR